MPMPDRFLSELEARVAKLERDLDRVLDHQRTIPHEFTELVRREIASLREFIEERKVAPAPTSSAQQETTEENRQLVMRDFYIAAGFLVAGWAAHAWILDIIDKVRQVHP